MPLKKPELWTVSPGLVAPEFHYLWYGCQFATPLLGIGGVTSNASAYGDLRDLITGKGPTTLGVMTHGVSSAGSGLYHGGTTSWASTEYATNSGLKFSSGDFTVACYGTVENTASSVILGNGGGSNQWRLQANYDGNSAIAGAFSLLTYAGAFSNVGASNVVKTSVPQLFLGRRKGTEISLWVDGVKVASKTDVVRDVTGSNSVGARFGWTSESVSTKGVRLYAMAWNHALLITEIQRIGADPFGPFRMADNYPAWMPAGAPPSGTFFRSRTTFGTRAGSRQAA